MTGRDTDIRCDDVTLSLISILGDDVTALSLAYLTLGQLLVRSDTHGCQVWLDSGLELPQIEQIQELLRSYISTFWLGSFYFVQAWGNGWNKYVRFALSLDQI